MAKENSDGVVLPMDLPDLNLSARTVVGQSRPPPRRFQTTLDPDSIHSILRTIALLLASIATIVQLMMPLFHSCNHLFLDSMDSNAMTQSTLCRALLFSHIVPSFLQALGLVHVRPRQIVDQCYIKPRTQQRLIIWIDDTPWEDPHRFQEFFRIGPPLFFYICELVHDDMITDPPVSLRILPNRQLLVMRQVALALRRLATSDTFLTLGKLFGVSKSSAVKVTWKLISSLRRRAAHVIRWPDQAGLLEVKQRFQDRWGFPNCCGAIDGTHFPIELPFGEYSTQYYDWKHKLSGSMQAICDQKLRFLDVCYGLLGSIQDTRLMRMSRFYHQVTQHHSRLSGPLFHCEDGRMLQEYIIGDAGYPLLPWLIVPFARGVSEQTDAFNYKLSSTRMCVERAFGRLKGTWRILSRVLWKPQIERLGPMIFSYRVLHNLIIDRNDGLPNVVWQHYPPHPPGYAGVLRPNRRMYRGGPEARMTLMDHVA